LAGPGSTDLWQIGEWVADASDDSISRPGESVKLEPRTMRLLMCLAESGGAVVGQERLLNEVWSGVVVGPASVYQSVSQLRKLLHDTDAPPTYIATVSRKGYRLIAPARRLEHRPPAPITEPVSAPAPVTPSATPAENTSVSAPTTLALREPDPRRTRWVVGAGLGLVVVVLLALAWAPLRKYMARAPVTPSIVVLPFVDMSSDKSEQAFCDGLTEELSSWLAQLPTLRVVARTSAFSFKDKPTDVREIGHRLDTSYVLEGSMRRTGSYMRISVQLIDARTGYHRWAGAYDAPLADVIKVQEDIARSIATNLEIRLANLTTPGFAARGSSNAEAYQLYLVAQHHRQLLSRTDNERAIALYKQAIAADPNFALAYIGLVYSYLNQQAFNGRPIEEISADAAPLLARVEKMHPELADLYSARGVLELHQMHTNEALRDLRHAVSLNPNSRDAYSQLGLLHLVSGEPREALKEYSSAVALDPLDDYLHAQRCMALQDLASYEDATAACETARALAPQGSWAYVASSWLSNAQGRLDEALHWNEEALKRNPGASDLYADRGDWLLAIGFPDRARATYQQAAEAAAGDRDALDTLTELSLTSALATGGVPALKAQLGSTHVDAASARTLLDIANAEVIAGDLPAARRLVARSLAQKDYGVQVDRDAAWLARTGYAYALTVAYVLQKTGEATASDVKLRQLSALLDRMIQDGVTRYGVYQLQAETAAVRGNADEAMRLLTHAADLGWGNAWRAQQEPFLAPLRARSDYQALIQRINARNSAMRSKLGGPEPPSARPKNRPAKS
jgi:TolB-like protein/DNA-binding winged helix-turn-helix (wHTH) protein/tetratricopeptide (TPR) repeat protein